MREIVLDTETTGLSPADGHRIVEIGCVELHNCVPTGETFHCYLNPERTMPAEAARVHGLTDDILRDKPVFAEVVDSFLTFIGESQLVIHNARFDLGFLNAELTRLGFASIPEKRAVDTVHLARRAFPGSPASLDALCRRFEIDTSTRQLHGALLDAQLLADVYLELNGGRQRGLAIETMRAKQSASVSGDCGNRGEGGNLSKRIPRTMTVSANERAAHEGFLDTIANALWRKTA